MDIKDMPTAEDITEWLNDQPKIESKDRPLNKNCLSYWFPKLLAAGIPVPKTEIVRTEVELGHLLDGKIPEGWDGFLAELNAAITRVTDGALPTPPIFLRTGHGSGKHNWDQCCYVDLARAELTKHIPALVEWSALVDFFGMATDVWVVRELLPVTPLAILPRYGNMPLVTEVRAFIEGGKLICAHPYWPEQAIYEGLDHPDKNKFTLAELGECKSNRRAAQALLEATKLSVTTTGIVYDLALEVAKVFDGDGAWSVDLLETKRGWYVTDMAAASQSYHWEQCPNINREWTHG